MKKITSEYSQVVFNLPWLVAQDEGLFAKEGIEVQFVRSPGWDATRPVITDPVQVDPFWRHKPFEESAAEFFNACEWGQIRRSNDSEVGGRIVMLRAAMGNQVIFVRGDSPITHPQMLREKTIAVNFHAGSHYLTLQLLEGFMARDEIKPVHLGQARLRYQALMDGTVDAATLMEPYTALAESQGCRPIIEGYYAGSEISAPDVDEETNQAINRAVCAAVDRINADKARYVRYLIDDLPDELRGLVRPSDFRLARLHYVYPRPYPEDEFERTRRWMLSWGLVPESACYEDLVDTKIAAG
ncbi:MAG: ABC transporter substrate-binding protein [Dehalococcoidia bacterium]|nr:ABC transporter substrate-binding protein [Dehalococcoidia bacterium]